MSARAFRLLGDAQLGFLRAQATRVAVAWAEQWVPGPAPAIEVIAAESATAPPGPWLNQTLEASTCHVQRAVGDIERAIFGAPAQQRPSALAGEAADAGLLELAQALLTSAGRARASTEGPAELEWRRGSGAVVVRIGWPAATLQCLLDGQAVAHWLEQRPRAVRPASPPLADLRSAIGAGRLRLDATAGRAEIDFATLQSLAIGDVIALDLRIDQPLRIDIEGRLAGPRAYLGFHGGRRAIRLTAGHDHTDPSSREKI